MAKWCFFPPSPTATSRDSNAAEFFAGSESADALVREAIQNSLDASDDDESTHLEVRFTFLSIAPAVAKRYFRDAWDHFRSQGNGLTDQPEFDSDCRVLLVEDFGTTGLEGDERTSRPPHVGQKNNFFNFFRAEARTDKDTHKFGQRGVGKDVFVSASRVRALFGLTIRESDRDRHRLLMGKCILKGHYLLGSQEDFFQDGFFGIPPAEGDTRTPVLPTRDAEFIDEFQTAFGIDRKRETGLTVVVPWVDEDIDPLNVAKAAVEQYFYPILRKRLRVVVRSVEEEIILDSSTIHEVAARLESDGGAELSRRMALATWSLQQSDAANFIQLKAPGKPTSWEWSFSLLNEEDIPGLLQKYRQSERIAIRVPVTVCKRNEPQEPTYFDVFLEQAPECVGRVRPTFLRGDLLISEVHSPTCSGVRAIVLATDRPISGFLGSSENPAHTQWEHKRHKDAYAHGAKGCLDYVKNIVNHIISVLTAHDREVDRTIFADMFPRPPEQDEVRPVRKTRTSRKSDPIEPPDPPVVPELEKKPRRYNFLVTDDGFRISSVNGAVRPDRIIVRAAYNIRRGNAFKKYDRADFRFDQKYTALEFESSGCEIAVSEDNWLEICPTEDSFELTVNGFDRNRDLIVRHSLRDNQEGSESETVDTDDELAEEEDSGS